MRPLNRRGPHHFRRWLLAWCLVAITTPAAAAPTPADMNTPGVEADSLAARAGWWNVVETVWARPGAVPEVIRNQVAQRRMVGVYLQEMLYSSDQPAEAKVHRMDYLGFNRVTGRWEYLSMDTRVAAGLMPAWSYERGAINRIHIQFESFALPGAGNLVTGQLLRMEEIIEQTGPDAETKDQYFILADGSGTKWLAHRYAYARKKDGL
jgi:hypothetical protein